MQAVIFCGGLGQRLGKLTKKTPKPLIKIDNKPFLEYLINNLLRFGIRDIVLLCHYKNDLFEKFLKKQILKNHNLKIKIITEKKKLGTAGSLLNAKKFLNNFFYLLNGDTYFNINYLDLKLEFKKVKKNKVILFALTKKKGNRYTNLKVKNGLIIKIEKNKSDIIKYGSYYVSKIFLLI